VRRTPIQHYPITVSCWASGSRHLNTKGNAFENESAPQPIADWHSPPEQSDWQVECSARIIRDLAEYFGRPLSYYRRPTGISDLTATEYEHNETVRFGGAFSTCPNKRIRWTDMNALLTGEEEDMGLTEEQNSRQKNIQSQVLQTIQTLHGGTSPARTVKPEDSVMGRLARIESRLDSQPAVALGELDYAGLVAALGGPQAVLAGIARAIITEAGQ
jgi:hypothetical protein